MCSVQDTDCDIPSKKELTSVGRGCMKCDEKAVLITRVNDAFCRSCFMEYVVHKFRAAIGKSKLIRHGERVLVSISGGPSSSAMLHLIQVGLSENTHKKFRFHPGILYIDEGAIVGLSQMDRLKHAEDVINKMKQTRFPFHFTFLEQGIHGLQNVSSEKNEELNETDNCGAVHCIPNADTSSKLVVSPEHFQIDGSATEHLQRTLKSLKSLSAKQEFIRNLRLNLMVETAKKEGYTKVMVGDSATRLSVRLLSDIAQGKGAHIPLETHFEDNRCAEVSLIRPMKDFSAKEISLYNTLNNIETVFIPSLTTKAPTNASIEHLTESFVTGLQADFPSTVSNIVRTGEKLDMMMKSSENYCSYCKAPLDTDVALASALNAVKFSQTVSCKSSDNKTLCTQSSTCCGLGDGSCSTKKSMNLSRDDVFPYLCYSCRLSVGDMNDLSLLPEFVYEDISKRIRRSKMKVDIEDFLLDTIDNDEHL